MTTPHDRQGSRLHYTHVYLWLSSRDALRRAQTEPAGSSYSGLLAIIAGALAIEAYLNYLGPKVARPWAQHEDRLPPNEKLKIIARAVGYDLHCDRSDYQALITLFRLRNRLAHGRPETVSGTWSSAVEGTSGAESLDTDWLRASRPDPANQLLGLVADLVTELNEAAGEEFGPFESMAEGESHESGLGGPA